MESLRKYFSHGAVGLIFGQTIGLFISTLFMGIKIMPILVFTVAWSIFGFYTGLLWNKGLKFGAIGIISGTLGGLIWYYLINPPSSIWGFGFILPGFLFGLFSLISAILINKINIKNAILFIGIAFSGIIISILLNYSSTLKDKFTGVMPPLIGFFSFLTSMITLGGLICIGLYYILGSSSANENRLKNTFTKLGKIVSVIWILFMFAFALGASHDAGYFIKKVNEPEFFVVVDAGEIDRYPYFAKAINDIEKGRIIEYSGAVPREEWRALMTLLDDQKKCRSIGKGNCFVKINNSFYEISFWTA
ncbi:hypothetical protein ANME2D_02905 [Candidatus Methanoperedens nitroreducens]|uniref:DUF4203 domain-containing protein n=1 Tax=Candidatus Methanoperedens nitratireducens TaxID=1392998 RepID=A0A062V500_9EURY|nr:hypothetical protein [Candidatus Methanoperedens nitroreducens]KCZ70879.1 hypothetical protein ANME2D_02905 [Candidatus Methanoperedens nitroreducens]MDJ1421753.1 hypothetical protein [Candidatus Methanoperedens sp.]